MKKTVKNIIITLISALLLLSISACTHNDKDNSSDQNPYAYLLEGFTYEKPELDL